MSVWNVIHPPHKRLVWIGMQPDVLRLRYYLIGVAVLMGSLTPYVIVPSFAFLLDRTFTAMEE